MIIDKDQVKKMIPQKEPFVMVDSLIEYNESSIKTRFEIKKDNLFINGNEFDESGLLENIAQSIALHTGYYHYIQNKVSPKGFIGAIKNVQLIQNPKCGDIIETQIEILQEFMGVTLVKAQVMLKNNVILTAQMKTVLEK